ENIIYLGDTARVPYGGKSPETVIRYSKEITNLLLEQNAKMIVIACNTASALALSTLKSIYSIPIHGVIEPGAAAAVRATKKGIIGVIGTRGTIASKAYQQAIHRLSPKTDVLSHPCPLLVPLVEEGLFEDEITHRVLERYLEPMLSQGIDTLVLGCTHYPLLKKLISRIIGPNVTLVDSAENCALAVQTLLTTKNLARNESTSGTLQVLLTDTSEDFLHSAANALQIGIDRVSIITLH
ncbi:MAG: glutamate racemase, partial [Chthoniobacterales bacterium]|nr:glutamate racemase [Chthoniobacterales bacterium]